MSSVSTHSRVHGAFRGLVERLVAGRLAAHYRDANSSLRGVLTSNMTPLHRQLHANSVKSHLDVTLLLLENGADSNSNDNRGRVPL